MNLQDVSVVVSLPAVDINRAKDFYQNKLKLRFMKTNIPDSVTFEAGNKTRIFLYKRGPTKADHTTVSFKVDNVLVTVNELKNRGVLFEEYNMVIEGTGERIKTDKNNIAHFGSAQAAWFKDTEGNILSIANH